MIRCACLAVAAMLMMSGCARNKPPEIISVKAFQEEIQPGDSVDVVVTASDPENGRLKYKWQAASGKLAGDKDSVAKWHAPDKPGKVKITVKVTDNKGAAVSKSVELQVTKATQVYTGSLGGESGTPRHVKPEKVTRPGRKGSGEESGSPGDAGGRKRGRRGTKGP